MALSLRRAGLAEHGRRDGLKHHCPQGRVGSNPTPGTVVGDRCQHVVVVHIRPQYVVDDVLRLSDAGMLDRDNAAMHGVAVKTVRRWRRLYQRQGKARGAGRRLVEPAAGTLLPTLVLAHGVVLLDIAHLCRVSAARLRPPAAHPGDDCQNHHNRHDEQNPFHDSE